MPAGKVGRVFKSLKAAGTAIAGKAGKVAAGVGEEDLFKRIVNWKTVGGLAAASAMATTIEKLIEKHGIPAELKGASRGQLKDLLAQLKAHRDPPSTRAIEEIAGLDRQMLLAREVASQSPPGAQPATPILDRLQVLNPDLLATLRKRMASATGGLWSDLSSGEVLIDGDQAPKSRAQSAADDQQLEVTLREETGFRRKTPIDTLALMG